MAYRLEQDNQNRRTIWVIKKNNREVGYAATLDEAQDKVQALIEDDNWHTMNRD